MGEKFCLIYLQNGDYILKDLTNIQHWSLSCMLPIACCLIYSFIVLFTESLFKGVFYIIYIIIYYVLP